MPLADRVLDFGLNVLDTEATHIMVCAAEPSVYSLCSLGAANLLGYKAWSAGGAFDSPSAHSINGRFVASTAITDGTIVTTGTAGWWAAIDGDNGRLLAHAALTETQETTAGNIFGMPSISVRIPSE
jgi:hypothetical protein